MAGAAAVVLGGVLLASGPGQGSMHALGMLAVAGAGLAWSIDNNLSQQLSLRDPVAVTRVKTLVAGGVNVAMAVAMGNPLPGAMPLAGALVTGFLGYGLSIVLHLLALRQIGTSRQAAYLATAPFIGAAASVPILGERLTWKDVAAGLVMAAGVAVLVRARHGHRHEHDALEHDHAHVHDEHHQHRTGRASLQRPTPTCTGTNRWPTTTRTSRTRITGTGTDLGRRRVDGGGYPPSVPVHGGRWRVGNGPVPKEAWSRDLPSRPSVLGENPTARQA